MTAPVVTPSGTGANAGTADGSGNFTAFGMASTAPGDLLRVWVSTRTAAVSTPSGWTLTYSVSFATTSFGYLFTKIATGSSEPDLTLSTTASARFCCIMDKVTGHGVSDLTTTGDIKRGTASSGTSVNPDPPSVTPGGTDDYLYTAVSFWHRTASTHVVSGGTLPTGYTFENTATGGSNTSSGYHVSNKATTASSSDDPDAATTFSASTPWSAQTFAIPPAGGGATVTGTLAETTADSTSAASGSHTPPVTGTLARTTADSTSAAAGAHGVSGSSAVTTATATSAAAGSSVTGTLASTTAASTSAASGTHSITGTVAVTTAASTSTASGTHTAPVTGTLARTTDASTAVASGVFGSTPTGTASVTTAAATSAAAGSSTTGTVARTTAAATSAAAGAHGVTGTLARTTAAATSAAAGTHIAPVTGTVARTTDASTSAASGTVSIPVTGTVAVTTANATSEASGSTSETVTGTVEATTAAATGTGGASVSYLMFEPPTEEDLRTSSTVPADELRRQGLTETSNRLLGYYRGTPRAASVLKIDGVYTRVLGPSTDQIDAATEVYLAGHKHVVTGEVRDELVLAGYTVGAESPT